VACVAADEPGVLVVARRGSPIVIGLGENETVVASDASAIIKHTRQAVYLDDNDVARIVGGDVDIRTLDSKPVSRPAAEIDWSSDAAEKGGYEHYMLKEIFEQPRSLVDTLNGVLDRVRTDVFPLAEQPGVKILEKAENLILIACGTSWHAGLVGKYLFEEMVRRPIQVDIGSEFRYREPMIQPGDVFIAISQSGETADTLAASREAKRRGARVLAIVNVVGSTLAREADGIIYTRCGPEVSVASTKAFTGQIIALYLLALHVGRVRKVLSSEEGRWWLDHFLMLPGHVEHILKQENMIESIAKQYAQKSNFLYLGRGINYPIALEGALKLKEISYIHAEGYAAGEMKHGPIALIDSDMPVVVLSPKDRLYEKSVSNLMEVRARSAPVIAFVSEGDHALDQVADHVFAIPDVHPLLTPLLFTVGLQLLAYYIAVQRGLDVDRPRNLAKSVTVE